MLATTKDLHGKDRLIWGQEKADLERKVADTEAKIREIIKYYETVDVNSSTLYKEAFDLFTKGELDEALAVLDEAKLQENEKKDADARILKAKMLALKYDFPNAETNYLKAVSIFPSFENNSLVASFYYDLNKFKEAQVYCTNCLSLAKTPDDRASTLNNLGNLQLAINEYPQAESSYQEALQIRCALAAVNSQAYLPDLSSTLANLAIFYLESVPDKERSVQYAEEVLSYRSSLEHIPAARECIEIAEAVLEQWQSN
ncbi:MAG: tetratricopeptide repeat protein [Odoribacteraceae bacterium]|nr:tetratricopeptide repeat protein [Odoribacteraceae bacterium]